MRILETLFLRLSRAAGTQGGYDERAYQTWITKYETVSFVSHLNIENPVEFHIVLDMVLFDTHQLVQTLQSLVQQHYDGTRITFIGSRTYFKTLFRTVKPVLPSFPCKRGSSSNKRFLDPRFREDDRQGGFEIASRGKLLQSVSSAARNLRIIPSINDLSIEETDNYVIFPGRSGRFAPNALIQLASTLSKSNNHVVYSDHDELTEKGQRVKPHFKPDINPDLLLSTDYTKDLVAIPADVFSSAVTAARNLNIAVNGRIINHLSLLKTDSELIHHVPKVLYHHFPEAHNASSGDGFANFLANYLKYKYLAVKISWDSQLEAMQLKWPLPSPAPLVSIIIPTYNRKVLVEKCINSILNKTDYLRYEIILIDNQSDEPKARWYLSSLAEQNTVRLLSFAEPFNYSRMNNYAAAHAKGEILAFVNNDLEVISPDWLTEMVSHASRPEIGCVGAKLLFPDDRVQHAGVIIGYGGVAGHAHKYLRRNSNGYMNRLKLVQNLSAVTAACLVMRRSVFDEVGGLNERDLTVAFNDVDLCLRVREAGYRNLWTPYAELYHHESASRGRDLSTSKRARFEREIAYMKATWKTDCFNDPAYNPNLSLSREDFAVRE